MGNSLYDVYERDCRYAAAARKYLFFYGSMSWMFMLMAGFATAMFVFYPEHRHDPHTWVLMLVWVAPFFCWKAYKNDAYNYINWLEPD
jgi:hypothetical protein